MPLNLGSVLEMTIQGNIYNQTTLNVFHYEVTTQSTTPLVSTEVNNFLQQWSNPVPVAGFMDTFLKCVPVSWTAVKYTAQAIFPTRYVRQSKSAGDVGERNGTTVTNLQASITLQTDFAGRKQVGGKRIVMTPEDAADGLITANYRTALQNFALNCILPIQVTAGGGIYTPVIYHRNPNLGPPSTIKQAFPQDTVRVIRRRTVGLGI